MELGAYMSLKKEEWSEDTWIPAEWNPSGQLGAIDHIVANLRQWVNTVRQYGEELRVAQSESDGTGYYYANIGDYTLEISPIENVTGSDLNLQLLPQPNMIMGQFPLPTSNRLSYLATDIEDMVWGFVEHKHEDERWEGNLENWEDPVDDTTDVVTYARTAGDLLIRYAGEMENHLIPEILLVRQEWVNEVRAMEGYAEEDFIVKMTNDYAGDGIRFAGDIAVEAEKAIASLRTATNTRASEEMVAMVATLKNYLKNFPEDPDLKTEDYGDLASSVDDLKEIASRQNYDDIRAWDSRSVQKQDALLALDKVRSYWAKRTVELSSPQALTKAYNRAQKDHNGTVPSYRFKMGQMVKVRKNRRHGKVVGSMLEGGTGKQMFEVRVSGEDAPKKYYTNELERAD